MNQAFIIKVDKKKKWHGNINQFQLPQLCIKLSKTQQSYVPKHLELSFNITQAFDNIGGELTESKNISIDTKLGTRIKRSNDIPILSTEFNTKPFLNKYYLPEIYRYPIYIPLKLLLKDLFKVMNVDCWTLQNRIHQWRTTTNPINWQLTFDSINWEDKVN
ncbi:11941_t:CDS:2 [Dentiscutata erythropus]|uniref:11941_t:CDS:1 n=1 Tax=Dentiscutata erythropus TaxID=1348616 RepID=A0A9N9A522_9GLOM|nr:11941_t:CDS:2 [Dentiscutata erythropus]